jgi:pantoate--beta-alanine ligase
MLVIHEPAELKAVIGLAKSRGKVIGLVPTMGALHAGHMALVKQSQSKASFTVVSIFVNPLQFNNQEDLDLYPHNIEDDLKLLRVSKVDAVFAPKRENIYPKKPTILFQFGQFTTVLEGHYRPGHFEGVGLVITKLFNIVRPDKAFFGLKDLQQFFLIKKIAIELSFDIEIEGVETVRDKNGLALSSRNQRLSAEGIKKASSIYEGLKMAEEMFQSGYVIPDIKTKICKYYGSCSGLQVEYCEIIDVHEFVPLETLEAVGRVAICVAAHVEGIRLIDNLYLRLD